MKEWLRGAPCRWCGYLRRWRVRETQGGGAIAVEGPFAMATMYPPACAAGPEGKCEAPRELLESFALEVQGAS